MTRPTAGKGSPEFWVWSDKIKDPKFLRDHRQEFLDALALELSKDNRQWFLKADIDNMSDIACMGNPEHLVTVAMWAYVWVILGAHAYLNMEAGPTVAAYRHFLSPLETRADELAERLQGLNDWMQLPLKAERLDVDAIAGNLRTLAETVRKTVADLPDTESRGRQKKDDSRWLDKHLRWIFALCYNGPDEPRQKRGKVVMHNTRDRKEREFVEIGLTAAHVPEKERNRLLGI